MSLYDKAKVIFSAAAGAGNKDVAYNIKPVEKLKVDELLTNGGFDSTDDWQILPGYTTVSITDGKLVFTNSAGNAYHRAKSSEAVFEIGKTYRVSFEVSDFSRSGGGVKIGALEDDRSSFIQFDKDGKYSTVFTAVGYDHGSGLANTELVFKVFGGVSETVSCKIDNVSVREVEQKANDFSFTRASDLTATYEGADGLIKKTRENLLTMSNSFSTLQVDGGWNRTTGAADSHRTVFTSGQNGYDGSGTAWKFEAEENGADPAGSDQQTYFTKSSLSTSGVQTFSIYAKAGNVDYIRLFALTSGTDPDAVFELTGNGTVTYSANTIATSIDKIGSGWYRCAMTYDRTLATLRVHLADGDGVSPGLVDSVKVTDGDYIFIQNAQLEQGLVATPYIDRTDSYSKSTAGIQEHEPRYDYSLDNDAPPVLMLEPERTNLTPHSEGTMGLNLTTGVTEAYDFDEVSPTGFKEGVVEVGNLLAASGDRCNFTGPIIAADRGEDFTGSCFVKGTSGEKITYYIKRSGGDSALSPDVVHTFNGEWQRISATFTSKANNTHAAFYLKKQASSTADSCFIWGYQIEKGSYATSYIPTYGSAATREGEAHSSLSSFRCKLDKPLTKKYTFVVDVRVDNLERPTTNFDDIFVARSQGALFNDYPFRIEGYHDPNVDPVTYSLRVFSYKVGDTGSGTTTPHTNGIQLGVRNKIAIVFDEDSGIKIFVNGNSTPMAESTEPGQMHDVHFLEGGGNPRSKTFLYGVQAYDEALSDEECVSLTTIS